MAGKFVLAGGTGFIGSAVARRLRAEGSEVVILTRGEPALRTDGAREVRWLNGIDWRRELEGAAAIINFAGSTIRCVHTAEKLRTIRESRIAAVGELGAAVRTCREPPRAWVQASAVGIYGNRGASPCDEATPPGEGPLADICRAWEGAFTEQCPEYVRPVVLRIGVVLGANGGAFPELARITRAFLGGAAGNGRQGMSWIWVGDLAGVVLRATTDSTMRGVYNATAPRPCSNAGFMRALRVSLHRPWSPPAPAVAVRLGARLMGVDPSLALEGQYVLPRRLLEEGFEFRAQTLDDALQRLSAQVP